VRPYACNPSCCACLQASGRVPVVPLDQVGDVVRLWRSGFRATYVYLAPQPDALLRERLARHVYNHPPPGYDLDDAGGLVLHLQGVQMGIGCMWCYAG
jgi:hypothetical protein